MSHALGIGDFLPIMAAMVLKSEPAAPPTVDAAMTTLDRLPVGQPAIVADMAGEGHELIRLRIMGLCVGSGVHTLRSGSRMIVCVGGTRIGLTSEVAAAVTVRPLDETPPCRA